MGSYARALSRVRYAVACISIFFVAGSAERARAQPTDAERTACAHALRYVRKGASVDHFLQECTYLANRIVWERGDGERTPYPLWPEKQRDMLHNVYDQMIAGGDLGLECPRPGEAVYHNARFYTAREAFDVYVAHVAHAFYLELTRGVAWSMLNMAPLELEELLDSSRYHMRIPATYPWPSALPPGIEANRDFQNHGRLTTVPEELLCDPRVGYEFLRGTHSEDHKNRIAPTMLETLSNISWWFARNVAHGPMFEPGRSELHALRVAHPYLVDRLTRVRYASSPEGPRVWEDAGCQSGANLLYDLARSVNIPLRVVRSMDFSPLSAFHFMPSYGHGGLVYGFGGPEPLVLWHTDDLGGTGNMFAIRDDGTAMTDVEMQRLHFDANWGPMERLLDFSYIDSGTFEVIGPGSVYANPHPLAFNQRTDEGYFAGWWYSVILPDGTYSRDGSVPYTNELNYQTCEHHWFVRPYCETGHVVPRSYTTAVPVPFARTQAELDARAAACVAAYGGCAEMPRTVARMHASFGLVGWQ